MPNNGLNLGLGGGGGGGAGPTSLGRYGKIETAALAADAGELLVGEAMDAGIAAEEKKALPQSVQLTTDSKSSQMRARMAAGEGDDDDDD